MTRIRRHRARRGNVLVLTLLMMVGMLAFLAFAVDVGYLLVARGELQRTADAAALAACWELLDEETAMGQTTSHQMSQRARTTAQQYANHNRILGSSPQLSSSDVDVGYLTSLYDSQVQVQAAHAMMPNAVRVRVRREGEQNGEVPLFFARILGFHSRAMQAEATAALLTRINGFRTPADGGNLPILPFALDLDSWNEMLDNIGEDQWSWNSSTGQIEAGPDGILEVNLFPQGTGSPGNRGTVNIGTFNNSTNHVRRQIREGISASDLEFHGGKLEFDANGQLLLGGNPGISAGFKDALSDIVGQPRIIPVFTELTGQGSNSTYVIEQFVGVRVLEVDLTGSVSTKRLIVQPAVVVTRGAIPGTDNDKSFFVYSPVTLVR